MPQRVIHLGPRALLRPDGDRRVCIGRSDDAATDGRIGRPLGAVVRILDGNDQPLEAGHVGNWRCTDPEYLGHISGTTGVEQRNGWVFTGDLARSHDDGSIELLGRRDSQVKTAAGRIVDGQAIAAVLKGHDDVVSVEIVPDPLGRAVARIEAVAGASGGLEIELRSLVRDHLGADAVPARVELNDALGSH